MPPAYSSTKGKDQSAIDWSFVMLFPCAFTILSFLTSDPVNDPVNLSL